METERFFCGYCRRLDSARTVEVVVQDGEVTEVDCYYGNCVHEGNCPIAKEIREMPA